MLMIILLIESNVIVFYKHPVVNPPLVLGSCVQTEEIICSLIIEYSS